MKKFIIFIFIILLNNSTSDAGFLSEMIKEKYHKYDLIHYNLNLDIDNKNHKIYADAEIHFKTKYDNLKSVYFLFNADFNVISVNRNEKLLKFSFQSLLSPMGALRVVLDEPLKINEECLLKIKYIIEFKSPQILGAKSYIDEEGAELSPTGLWFPMMVDEECTFALTIIAPEDKITIGTGELIEIKNIKKDQDSNFVQYKYEIKKPISLWAMSICEHKYKKFSFKHKEYVFEIYVFEKQEKYVDEILKDMKFVFDFYENKFGKFPIKKYKIITKKEGSGLSAFYHIELNENIVENINAKDENAKLIWYRVLYHETGHLWAPSSDIMGNYSWLCEGLTEYLFFLAYQERFGKENGKKILERWQKIYLDEIQKKGESPIIKTDLLTPGHFGVVYNKGAYVFHMLHYILGDEKFYELIRNFSSKWKWKNASFSDFKNSLQEVVKEDLDWFFKDWIESTKKLDYAISDVKSIKEKDGYTTTVTVSNLGEISMPVDVEILIETKKEKEIKKVKLLDKTQNISFNTKEKISSITIDPNYWLLDVDRENNEWRQN